MEARSHQAATRPNSSDTLPATPPTRYRSIFVNSHAVMLILDPGSGRIIDANPAAEAFYGWPHDVLTRMHITDINTLSPAEVARELKAAQALQRNHFEFRHRRADGSIRDVEVHSGPAEDGDRALIFSIVHDITERKQAEAASRRWERFFRMSNLGIAMHGVADNTIIDANETYARQHGYTVDELRGMDITKLYAPEAHQQLAECLAEADRTGSISFEAEHLRKDGSRMPMVIGVTTAYEDEGGPVARFAFALDISARKAAEEKLRKLSRAVEESPESIVITNTAAEIEYVNEAFVRNTGYSRTEAIGQNPRVLQSGRTTPETYRQLWDTLTEGKPWRGELFNRRKDGSEYLELVTITPIHDESGATTHYVAVKQDITEQRRMELELQRYHERLEGLVATRTIELQQALDAANVASRAKSEFLTTMSHEIRTPMNGVIGLLDVLERSPLTTEQTHLVRIMRESASTLLQLIDDILDFSKIESGNLELDIGPVSLQELLDRVVDIMQPVAERKRVRLTAHIGDDTPAIVRSDGLRLRQILLNLLSNAVKFSAGRAQPGEVALDIDQTTDGMLRFSVKDNGIGISPQALEKIFQPFSQAESSTTRRFGGTGLGLSISTRLIELLEGRIEVQSLPGQGATFIVTLPVNAINGKTAHTVAVTPPASAPPSLSAPPSHARPRVARGRILVAEDNDINRRVIERQLALLGLQCDLAEDGYQALARWRSGAYAMLLSDLHMPGMDGYELTARIRGEESTAPHMPIIAITANARRGEAQRCIDAGMDDFIVKPVEVAVLRQVLGRWMQLEDHATAGAQSVANATPASPPVFDPQVLPGLIGDDPALVAEFLGDYRRSLHETLVQIRAACKDGQWRRAGELAHRLKSSSRSVGAMQLGEHCAALELAGRNEDGPGIPALVQDVEASGDAVLAALASLDDTRAPAETAGAGARRHP